MNLLQLNPTIPVLCREHGYGEAFIMSDVSIDVNPIYHVRFPGGIVKHFYSDDIRIVGNPMNGNGWDVKEFEDKEGLATKDKLEKEYRDKISLQTAELNKRVRELEHVTNRIPANAKRNTDFIKYFISVTNPHGQNIALYLKRLDDKGIVETTPYLHEALHWNTLKGVTLYVDETLKNLRNKDIYTVISHNTKSDEN